MNKKQQKLSKQLNKKQPLMTSYDQVKADLAQPEGFSVAHLLDQLNPSPANDKLIQHLNRVTTRAKLVQEPEQKRERDAQERLVTATVMKQNLKKWLPIVKHNREANHLDFTKRKDVQEPRINSGIDILKNNPIASEIELELRKNQLASEKQVQEAETMNANPLSKKALLEQQQQLSKKTSLAFYQELKNKRISKIKSKVYHRIKKKHSDKEKLKLMAQLNPIERQREIEKMKEERAKVKNIVHAQERVTLRHSTKNKFTQSLMRFGGDKQSLQQQQNYLNNLRQQLLKKAEGQFDEDDLLDELNDEEFKEQAINQLEAELMNIEEQENQKGVGLKFLERQKTESLTKSKSSIMELIQMLKTGNYKPEKEDLADDEEKLSWEGSDDEQKKVEVPDKQAEEEEFTGRGVFKKEDTNKPELKVDTTKRKKRKTGETLIKQYLSEENGQKDKKEVKPTKKEEEKKILTEIKDEMNEQQRLLQGLNFGNLKAKYKKMKTTTISTTDDQILRENLANFVMNFDEEENAQKFMKDKLADMEAELPPEEAPMKGWGTWAGFGVKQKKPPSQEEILQRKVQKIKEIQKKRKDASLEHVIINENRDSAVFRLDISQFSKFLVKELPFEYQTKEQFDYVNAQAVGPEWNSYRGHQALVKPRVITKAGHVINPIQVPRKSQQIG